MGKITYKDAGVNIEEGYRAVAKMKEHIAKTFNQNVLTDIGSFGGLFQLPLKDMKEPVLVAGTDGVGTKLKLAFMADKHDTVGIDLVAMCVNDVLCQGAMPLFFLDYIATGSLDADRAAELVKGVAVGCQEANCALIGGETAEMPDFYPSGEYDMAGFTVGLVDKEKIIDGSTIKEDDVVIGIASSGVHSNGYSLVRKLIFDVAGLQLEDTFPNSDKTVAEILLEPTKIYVKALKEAISQNLIKGAAHITGGGFIENIPRALPEGLGVMIERERLEIPNLFQQLQQIGNLDENDMFNTFNMGYGFVLVVAAEHSEKVLAMIENAGEKASVIGKVCKNKGIHLV